MVEAIVDGGLIEPPDGVLRAPEEEGVHWLAVASRDEVDNTSEVRWARLLVDGTPPRVILSIKPRPAAGEAGERWVARNAVLSVAGEDDLCAVVKTGGASGVGSAEADGPVAQVPIDGGALESRVLTGWAEDAVGNRSGEARLEVMVDPWPPQGRIECSGPCIDLGSRRVIAEATRIEAHVEDPQSGVAQATLQTDGADVAEGGWDGPWSGDSYELTVAVADRAGNTGTVGPVTLAVDREGPQISWEALGRGTLAVAADDALAGVESIEWSLDGDGWGPVLGRLRTSASTVYLRATDRVGNVSEETVEMGVGR